MIFFQHCIATYLNALLLIFFPSISFFSKIDVIHTVGPTNGSKMALVSCYETCLQLVLDYKIRSVVCLIFFGVSKLRHHRNFNAQGAQGVNVSFLSRPSLHVNIGSYKDRKIQRSLKMEVYDLPSSVTWLVPTLQTKLCYFLFSLFLLCYAMGYQSEERQFRTHQRHQLRVYQRRLGIKAF